MPWKQLVYDRGQKKSLTVSIRECDTDEVGKYIAVEVFLFAASR